MLKPMHTEYGLEDTEDMEDMDMAGIEDFIAEKEKLSPFQRLRHLLIPTEDAIMEATGALVDMDIEDITTGKEKLRQMLMHIEVLEDTEEVMEDTEEDMEDIEGDTGDRAFIIF